MSQSKQDNLLDKQFKKLLNVFEKAVRQHEFKGGFHPDTHQMIEGNYRKAKKDLINYVTGNEPRRN